MLKSNFFRRQTSMPQDKKQRPYTVKSLIADLERRVDFTIFSPEIMLQAFGWNGSTITLDGSTFKLLPVLLERKAFQAFRLLIEKCRVNITDINACLLQICSLDNKDDMTNDMKLSLAQMLLDYGASCAATDTQGRTALQVAYESNASLQLLSLIAWHANTNAFNQDGQAVLHQALRANNTPVVRMILHSGANVNLEDGQGQLPLVLAAQHCSDDSCLRMLLRSGARLDLVKDAQAHFLLKSPESALAMLQRGLPVDTCPDKSGVTYLHTAFGDWCTWSTLSDEQLEFFLFQGSSLVDALLETTCNINVMDQEGRTPLHYACRVCHSATPTYVKDYLLVKGADIHACDKAGWTPLHAALAAGNYATAQVLVEQGANLESKDKLGRTPIHVIDQYSFNANESSAAAALVNVCLHRGFDFCTLDAHGNLPFVSASDPTAHFAMVHAAACQGLFR